jgi:glycosyltransferase involved in cell wall biosynthesis
MDNRIRILLIIFSFDIEAVGGGITRFVVSLGKSLDPSKFRITLCGLWNRGTPIEADRIKELNKIGIDAFTCAPWNPKRPYNSFYHAYRTLRTVLKKEPVDVLHSHSLFGDIVALLLRFEGKAPSILRTLHNELRTEWSRKPLRRLFLTNFLYPLIFDAEIGVSQFIAESLNQRWIAKRLGRKAITIYNAVDINRFTFHHKDRMNIRRKNGIPEDAFVLGSIGRLTRQKGYDILICATTEIIQHCQSAFVVIIGDGEDADILKQQVMNLKLENRVLFTGSRPDVEELLSIMDLFVCSSRWEGLSTAVLEAMAAGVPVIATDIPGNRELLQHGISAWFVTPNNYIDLANGVVECYQNQKRSETFALNASSRVNSFRIEKIAKIHEYIYQFYYERKNTAGLLNHKNLDERIINLLDDLQLDGN